LPPKTINDYRLRFRKSPFGRWSQASGTFSSVMDEIWEFNPDYTGKIIETGPFGGERDEMLFEWQEVADLAISCKVIKWFYDDELTELSEWVTIRYDFDIAPTDCGEVIAMYQVSDDGTFKQGFWHSMLPLINNDRW
jgi:hypothetical protein